MFFKSFPLLIVFTLLTQSCSLRVNEKEVSAPSISATSAQQGCLTDAAETFSKFIEGNIGENELNKFWQCLTNSFQLFAENTRGNDASSYAPEELAGFMSKYFLDNKPIPSSLLKEAMILKKGVLGGSLDKITRTELKQTVTLIRSLHTQSMRLRPYMPIGYQSIIKRSLNDEQLEETLTVFEKSMQEIGKSMEGSIGVYNLNSFSALLRELKLFAYKDTEKNWVDTALSMTEVIGPAKSVFIAPPASELRENDWPQFFYLVPKYFTLYMRAAYYMQTPRDYTHGDGLSIIDRLFTNSIELVNKSIDNHPGGIIEESELDALLVSLSKKEILPGKLEDIQKLLKVILDKFFPDKESKGKMQVSKNNTHELKNVYIYATDGLRAAETVYRKLLGDSDFLIRSITKESFLKFSSTELVKGTLYKNNISKNASDDLRDSIKDIHTIFPNSSNTVFVSQNGPLNQYSYSHVSKIHLLRTINSLILRAYSNNSEIDEEQITKALKDFSPLLSFFEINGEDLIQGVKARLFEASLFLPNSDGLTTLKMEEALEFETLLISTFERAGKIHEYLSTKCPKQTDSKGNSSVQANCYRRQFSGQIKKFWDYIPGLADFMEKQNASERIVILQKMDQFLRKNRVNAPYTDGDSKSFVLMPYYIELLFSRFDANRDGLLDQNEAKVAYPVFRPFLAKKATALGYSTDDEHYKIFTFILSHLTLPTTTGEKLQFVFWDKDGEFETDRGDLVTIFATILSL